MFVTKTCDPRKEQQRTTVGGDDSSLTTHGVVVPALSFGNILKEFPDFLFCVLYYIANRVIWNSIASSNKDMYEKSKAILPPWPIYYKLPLSGDNRWSWSPCGTRIACLIFSPRKKSIAIIDQRRGPICNNNNATAWFAHQGKDITDFNFSPNGMFLVTAGIDGDDSFVKLWDNSTGNYELLHELNMKGGMFFRTYRSISACSKYILTSTWSHIFLTDIENDRTNSLRFQSIDDAREAVFSNDHRVVFILCHEGNTGVIKVWHPYLDDDNEDYLITLWRQTSGRIRGAGSLKFTCTFSHDNTMVAIHDVYRNNAKLWSIDMDNKCLTHKSDFAGSVRGEPLVRGESLVRGNRLHFTPDDKYIIYQTETGPRFWNIAGGKRAEHTIHVLGNPMVKSISPNNRQLVVRGSGYPYIASYFVN